MAFDRLLHFVGRRTSRWSFFLGTLLLLLVGMPAVDGMPLVGPITHALMTLLMVSSVLAVSDRPRILTIALVAALPGIVLTWLVGHDSLWVLRVASIFLHVALFSITALVILYDVVNDSDVSWDTICGAIAGYLLLGVVFGLIFAALVSFHPDAFAGEIASSMTKNDGPEITHDFIYLSFVTLTTLGYGDIRPVSHWARTLCWFEAVVGQLYLAILIAGLVGARIARQRDKN